MIFLRIFLGGIAGYAIFAIGSILLFHFSGIDPHADAGPETIALVIVCGAIFAFIGGYVAKLIAPKGNLTANYAVLFITMSFAAFSLLKSPGNHYTQLAATFLFGPLSFVGGLLRWRMERR